MKGGMKPGSAPSVASSPPAFTFCHHRLKHLPVLRRAHWVSEPKVRVLMSQKGDETYI